jgi:hypothetical protein
MMYETSIKERIIVYEKSILIFTFILTKTTLCTILKINSLIWNIIQIFYSLKETIKNSIRIIRNNITCKVFNYWKDKTED